MGIFGPKRPLSRDELDWQLAAIHWLVNEDGGLTHLRGGRLATPDGDYFADSTAAGQARAEQRLAEVKALCGMSEGWPTRLIAQEPKRGFMQVSEYTIIPAPTGAAAGSFQLDMDGNEAEPGRPVAEISYDPALLDDEPALIATLAHELAHFRLTYCRHSFPGGHDLHEHLTDLCAVHFGFGIFLANNARDYRAGQTEMGGHQWQFRAAGYLSERALVTALVITERLAGRDPDEARIWLKPYLRDDLALATRYFRDEDVEALVMASDLARFGVEPWDDGD